MKILSYNIQFGRGLDEKISLERIASEINDADIICLQEVDSSWSRSGNTDQAEAIAAMLPNYYYVFGSSFDVDNSARRDDGSIDNRHRKHGNMILSRWPILSKRTFNLPKAQNSLKFNMCMSCVESVINLPSGAIRVYCYHAGYLTDDEHLQQIGYFSNKFDQSPIEGGAWCGKPDIDGDDWGNRDQQAPAMPYQAIVCGDLNTGPNSLAYKLLLDRCQLFDCWQLVDPVNLNTPTIKRAQSEDIKITGKIDHILVTSELVHKVEAVGIDFKAKGSDHHPVFCVLNL